MMQADDLSTMTRLGAREKYSLLHYLADAFPWTASDEQEQSLGQLRKIIAEEKTELGRVLAFLTQHKVAPGLGRFPISFQSLHFIGLDYLLPQLVTEQRRVIQELAKDADSIDDAEARDLARQLLEVKMRHLRELEWLATENAKVVSTVR